MAIVETEVVQRNQEKTTDEEPPPVVANDPRGFGPAKDQTV